MRHHHGIALAILTGALAFGAGEARSLAQADDEPTEYQDDTASTEEESEDLTQSEEIGPEGPGGGLAIGQGPSGVESPYILRGLAGKLGLPQTGGEMPSSGFGAGLGSPPGGTPAPYDLGPLQSGFGAGSGTGMPAYRLGPLMGGGS